jgi:hypothetical protein
MDRTESRTRVGHPQCSHTGVSKIPPAVARRGTWDRDLDGPDSNHAAGDHVGIDILAVGARVGISLFFTAGFAAALNLNSGLPLGTLKTVPLCECFFVWVLVLVSCTLSRRASSPCKRGRDSF